MATVFWPFPRNTVTEWPGQRPGSYHVGTDFGVPQGTQLRATLDGTVSRWVDQYGAYIVDVRADDGLLARHGHLSRIDVPNGHRVRAGDIIGLTGGQPGTLGAGWSTGPHLHWELRRGSAWIDPRNLNPQPLDFGQQPILETEKMMKLVWDTNGKGYLATDDGIVWVENGRDYDLFVRLIKSTPDSREVFLSAEIDIMNRYLHTLAKSNSVAMEGATVTVQVDNNAIAKAVNDDAARRMQS